MNCDDAKIKTLKRQIIQAAHLAKEGHIASAFSVLDIVYILYRDVLDITPEMPRHPDRDYFILSKGHASLALYAVLADAGFIGLDELTTFARGLSRLGGHPCKQLVPGVEASTGSLGHGLPMAVGLAMSLKKERRVERVFCIIGDGEMNEGTVWESLLLAGHHELNNLTVILDYNHSNDRALRLPLWDDNAENIIGRMKWRVECVDGHNNQELKTALGQEVIDNRPYFVVANTVKGKGVMEMEANPHAWHHRAPTDDEFRAFMEELT
jgi:transketolase